MDLVETYTVKTMGIALHKETMHHAGAEKITMAFYVEHVRH